MILTLNKQFFVDSHCEAARHQEGERKISKLFHLMLVLDIIKTTCLYFQPVRGHQGGREKILPNPCTFQAAQCQARRTRFDFC